MTELVTSGSVGGMASNGCLYPEESGVTVKVLSIETAASVAVLHCAKGPELAGYHHCRPSNK